MEINSADRRALRARAHGLHPLVTISTNGLTESVLREIDTTLKAHELIKIRAVSDERETRLGWLHEICARLDCSPVQVIGKILVVFRAQPKQENSAAPPEAIARPARPYASKAARSSTQKAAAAFIQKRLKARTTTSNRSTIGSRRPGKAQPTTPQTPTRRRPPPRGSR